MRFLIGLLVAIGLIVLILVLIFTSGSSTAPQGTDLTKYVDTGSYARLVVEGPESAPDTHRELQITVSADNTTLQETKGYQGETILTKTYPMSSDAYRVFLRALQGAGYAKGDTSASDTDETGHCPLGRRYVYEFNDGNKTIERFWNTSCSGEGSTFSGNTGLVQSLFKAQVPDYDQLGIDLSDNTGLTLGSL